ncbi:MAG: hypothetical protein ACQES9_00760 [Myxococcota bacterium]
MAKKVRYITEKFLHDKRLINQNLSEGYLNKEEYHKYLDNLDDSIDNAAFMKAKLEEDTEEDTEENTEDEQTTENNTEE